MLKRTLIVILIAVAIVFAPYFAGKFVFDILDWNNHDNVLDRYVGGFISIFIATIAFGTCALLFAEAHDYIKGD